MAKLEQLYLRHNKLTYLPMLTNCASLKVYTSRQYKDQFKLVVPSFWVEMILPMDLKAMEDFFACTFLFV